MKETLIIGASIGGAQGEPFKYDSTKEDQLSERFDEILKQDFDFENIRANDTKAEIALPKKGGKKQKNKYYKGR